MERTGGALGGAGGGAAPLPVAGRRAFMTDPGLAEASVASLAPLAPPEGKEEDGGVLKATVTGATQESQATLLLKKRKDMRMVEDALEVVKREFRERMERLAERELRFGEKQKGLQDMVAKFKPFLAENDAKRSRAEKKRVDEAAACARIEAEIAFLTRELETLRAENGALERQLRGLRRYARYLDSVVSASSTFFFESAGDVLTRHTVLTNTNRDLHGQAASSASELDELRAAHASLQKRLRDLSLVASSGGQDTRAALEAARAVVADLSAARDFAESDGRRKRATAGQAVASIRNLYARVAWTAPPTSLPTIIVGGRAMPPPTYHAHAGGSGGQGQVSSSQHAHSAAAAAGGTAAGGADGDGGPPPGGALGPSASVSTNVSLSGRSGPRRGSTMGGPGSAGAGTGAGAGQAQGSSGSGAASGGGGGALPHMSAADTLSYLSQCLDLFADRVADLGAIVAEYPAWRDAQAREKEAAAKARAALLQGASGGGTAGAATASGAAGGSASAAGGPGRGAPGASGGGAASGAGGRNGAARAAFAAEGVSASLSQGSLPMTTTAGMPPGARLGGTAAAAALAAGSVSGSVGPGHGGSSGGGMLSSTMIGAPMGAHGVGSGAGGGGHALVPGMVVVAGAASNIYVAPRLL